MSDEIYSIDPEPGHKPLKGLPQALYAPDWISDDLKPYRWYHALRDRFLCWWYGV